MKKEKTIAIIGLGYVGLPLAVEFGKNRKVLGFDINENRIAELRLGYDQTLECCKNELAEARYLQYTTDPMDLQIAEIFIVTVPTPVDGANQPDMQPLISASRVVGNSIKIGDIVVYESTVYPGATEEVCVPIIEKESGLKFNKDFFCGYSPERINPGDKEHRLINIKKITSGSTPKVADEVDRLYGSIVTAGTHKASSIKVAEAAKVIENTQRDVNIALMNELSIIFNKIGIDTIEVLKAAGTKWNFLPFRPGLVGGHCIGVDPYYLTHKAQQLGYHSEVILAGRRINDSMACHIADRTIKLMLANNIEVLKSRILILGLTFKENCPDVRNTKVVEVYKAFQKYNSHIDVYDPWVNVKESLELFGISCLEAPPCENTYDAIVMAVSHKQFLELGPVGIKNFGKSNSILFDVKSIFPLEQSDGRL